MILLKPQQQLWCGSWYTSQVKTSKQSLQRFWPRRALLGGDRSLFVDHVSTLQYAFGKIFLGGRERDRKTFFLDVTDHPFERSVSERMRGLACRARFSLHALLLLCCAPRAGLGYVVLTKEGYSVEHKLFAEAGARVGVNLTIHGLAISTPSAALRCNPSRRGALRWSHDDNHAFPKDGPRGGSFEACDGEFVAARIMLSRTRCD